MPMYSSGRNRHANALYAKSAKEIERHQLLQAEPEPFEYPAEDFLIARELEGLMEIEVQKMPSTMRQVFLLSRKEHISIREIAAMLSVSEQTVKNNITLALQHLRGKLTAKRIIQLLPFFVFLN